MKTFPIIGLIALTALVLYALSREDVWEHLPWKSPVSIEDELDRLA